MCRPNERNSEDAERGSGGNHVQEREGIGVSREIQERECDHLRPQICWREEDVAKTKKWREKWKKEEVGWEEKKASGGREMKEKKGKKGMEGRKVDREIVGKKEDEKEDEKEVDMEMVVKKIDKEMDEENMIGKK